MLKKAAAAILLKATSSVSIASHPAESSLPRTSLLNNTKIPVPDFSVGTAFNLKSNDLRNKYVVFELNSNEIFSFLMRSAARDWLTDTSRPRLQGGGAQLNPNDSNKFATISRRSAHMLSFNIVGKQRHRPLVCRSERWSHSTLGCA